ncbi:BamA/TamA family outer membrane protein, partial [Candidatus Poribacteria bacterium]|nr:BamA/TamA family outer membrane protein [Candidatus Poribacteria bacterium]
TLSGGFASRILNYSFGIEKSFFNRNPLAIGLGFFKLSDISNNAFRDFPVEPNLTAAAYGIDSADYYQRDGQQYWMAQSIGNFSMLRAEITMENHSNLSKSTDWSYYERNRIKRGNARIDKGRMNTITIGYTIDTRDEKSKVRRPQFLGSNLIPWPNDRTKRGWRGNIGIDIAGKFIGGDFKYNLYRFDLVRYTPIYRQHHFNIRVSGHVADAPLPSQRLLYLGGAATLRGYDYNSFAGDKRILVNVEYRFQVETEISTNPDVILGTALYTFMDTGQVWWHDENPISEFAFNELKTSAGVGISFFLSPPDGLQPLTTAFEFAVPINIDESLRTTKLIWRLERMF